MLAFIASVFLLCRTAELVSPGWRLPRPKSWPRRVALMASLELITILSLGWLVRGILDLPQAYSLAEHLSPILSGVIAYLLLSPVFYCWHRIRHTNSLLWRMLHQLHHSPRRIEAVTAFYRHPLEVAANTLLSALLVYLVLGLSVEGAAAYTACTVGMQIFVHSNIRTPYWLGYFVQRPEMHRIHHQATGAGSNFSDVPLWDILFGTFVNPETFSGNCGFSPGREERLGDLLAGIDLHAARNGKHRKC